MVYIAQITSGLRGLRAAYTVGLMQLVWGVVLWGYQGWLLDSSSLRFWPFDGASRVASITVCCVMDLSAQFACMWA